MKPTFFKSGADFGAWLERQHRAETEILLGFYKKGARKKGITYQEALDEALAFGWIDAIRRGRDADSYTICFTPRKPRSIWSAVNIRRVGELTAAGRMADAGHAAHAGWRLSSNAREMASASPTLRRRANPRHDPLGKV
jgi:uncharacterized protein YdeI (YjbR/CyaY-like superfamily)